MRFVSAERNKSRVLDLIERVMNGHDADALGEFTSNPAVLGAARGLLQAFPDLVAQVQWIVAEDDMVVTFHSLRGTQQGPWLFVKEPTGSVVETAFLLAFRFDDGGQIIDQWLGSNFVEMLVQMGWGFAPVGQTAALPH
jgi:predicted ester cyclase